MNQTHLTKDTLIRGFSHTTLLNFIDGHHEYPLAWRDERCRDENRVGKRGDAVSRKKRVAGNSKHRDMNCNDDDSAKLLIRVLLCYVILCEVGAVYKSYS